MAKNDTIQIPKINEEIPWVRNSRLIAKIAGTLAKKKGLTQAALADKIGVSQQYVSKILKGQENLSLDTITGLGDALGVNFFSSDLKKVIYDDDVAGVSKCEVPQNITNIIASPVISACTAEDRRVYVNMETTWMFERTGIIVEKNDEKDFCQARFHPYNVTYIDETGGLQYIDKESTVHMDDKYKFMGFVGDTVKPSNYPDVYKFYQNNGIEYYGIDTLLYRLERFFKIDWDSAPDTVKIRFRVVKDGVAEVIYDGDFFLFERVSYNLDTLETDDSDKCPLCDGLVAELYQYQIRMKRPLKLDVDFEHRLYYKDSLEEMQEELRILKEYREKYLGKIRDYITSELSKILTEETEEFKSACKAAEGDGKVLSVGFDGSKEKNIK